MKKKIVIALAFHTLALCTFGQVIFNSSFNTLSLQSYTTASSSTSYTTVPSGFSLINDNLNNNIGSLANPNSPFQVPALKTTGWATVYNAAENDTFLVSTSWLDTTGVNVDRWVLTPTISIASAATVLTWRAKSPDPSFPDGYEVYGTSKQGVLIAQDFSFGDKLFAIQDGNTAGGGEKSTWTRHSVNLSGFVGNTLRFAFHNNSKDMYQVWIDDIQVVTLPNNNDASVQNIITDKYVLINSSNVIKVNVKNMGATDINNLGISYSINNSSTNSEAPTLTEALSYGQSGTYTFGIAYMVSSPGLYTIKSWINSVNTVQDQNRLNDTAVYYVTVLPSAPARAMMIEQFVSANSGESTEAQAATASLQSANAIVVNIHDGDSLKESGSAALIADYKQNYASALFDRFYFDGTSTVSVPQPAYGTYAPTETARVCPASISIQNKTYNQITRELAFTVQAVFAGRVKGDYRINAYLTENNVCGPYADTTVNGYNQVNGYFPVSWSQFYHQGYYSAAANEFVIDALHFKHQNVLVHSFDGAYGLPGLIPLSGVTEGQSFQKTYTLSLPAARAGVHKFNPDNIYIVGFIAEYDADKTKRTVLNTVQQKLNSNPEFVGIPELSHTLSFEVYPNPSNNGMFYLDTKPGETYELKVTDVLGKCLKTDRSAASGILDLSQLPGGIYLMSLRSGKEVLTKKLIIQKN